MVLFISVCITLLDMNFVQTTAFMLESQTDFIEKVPKILKQKKMSRTRQDFDPNIPIYANCFTI